MTRFAWFVLIAVLLPACAPDATPPLDIPSWAKVAPEQIAEAKKHRVPVALENDLGMRFVLIPAGTFMMGSPEDEEGRNENDIYREVSIPDPYYLQITEVTNEQYEHFDPDHDSGGIPGRGRWLDWPDMPVVAIPVQGAEGFVKWLGDHDTSREYRLPTEAEWERACRGGTTTRYWWGDSADDGHKYANAVDRMYEDENPNDGLRGWSGADGHVISANVGSYPPNPYGLYDMLGNASELVAHDLELQGKKRCVRGGCWQSGAADVRCATRYGVEGRYWGDGFRLTADLPAKDE